MSLSKILQEQYLDSENFNNMKTIYFTTTIDADPQKVYDLMLGHDTYREWTKPFSPTSGIKGNWEEDSKMFFTSTDQDGLEAGMISMVDKNIPAEIVIIRHIGMFNHIGELYEGEMIDNWKNALEVYRFKKIDGKTELICSVEVSADEDANMFDESWPEALRLLKEICEK